MPLQNEYILDVDSFYCKHDTASFTFNSCFFKCIESDSLSLMQHGNGICLTLMSGNYDLEFYLLPDSIVRQCLLCVRSITIFTVVQ